MYSFYLASFAQHSNFEIYPCCWVYQFFLSLLLSFLPSFHLPLSLPLSLSLSFFLSLFFSLFLLEYNCFTMLC